MSTARAALAALREIANPQDALFLQRFFKTGPGQYGEGDVFLGIRVPATRTVARQFRDLPLEQVIALLHSKEHEARLLALLILVDQYKRGEADARQRIYDAYLANTKYINNWDLVDLSAPSIVGVHLETRSRAVLTQLAKSEDLWERRIAMIATQHFIRRGDLADTMRIARLLLDDSHDLIHKAIGWMLREAGKKDRAALDSFLNEHYRAMPRTALRYAIEKHSERERKEWLARR